MLQIKLLTVTAVVALATALAPAADITWIGINYVTPSTATDIEDGANWSSGTVPGAGDSAIFAYSGNADSQYMGNLYIDSTTTTFNPDGSLTFLANQNPDSWRQSYDLYIDKNLTLSGDLIMTGYPGSSGRDTDRLQIGMLAQGVTINIGGSLDISQSASPSWSAIRLGIGDASPGNSTVINLTGNATFATPSNSGTNYPNSITSAPVNTENATNDMAPQMRFTGSGATITLQQAGKRTGGTIALGWTAIDARSDQTWVCDDLAFITMYGNIGAAQAGKYIVESIDGGRLDNLGALNIRTDGDTSSSGSVTTGMRLMGGTYGSLWMNSTGSSGRTQWINMTGDVSMMKQAVAFDVNGDPVQSG